MKILHLIERYLPPSQVWLYHLLAQQEAHEHHIATFELLPHNFYHPKFNYTVSRLSAYRHYIQTLRRDRPLDRFKRLALLPTEWIVGDETAQWAAYIEEKNIQLIHAHFANMGCQFMLLKKNLSIPFIVSFYGHDYKQLPIAFPHYAKLYPRLFQQADHIFCEGPYGKSILIEQGCPEEKIKIEPLNIDWKNIPFTLRKKPVNELRLVQVADFTEKKGQLHTVYAFAKALPFCPGLSLTLVGAARSATYHNEVIRAINDLELSNRINILPFVPYSQLFQFLQEYDVFIHPSCHAKNGDCEGGAPVILLDAQAAGMPVISTRHCDIPAVVLENQTALLSDESDIEGISKAISRLYTCTEEDFAQMSTMARRWIEKRALEVGINYLKYL